MTTINNLDSVTKGLEIREMEKVAGSEHEPKRRGGRAKDTRPRKHLEEAEIEALIHAATVDGSRCRYPLVSVAIVTLTYNHGLRVSELCSMLWTQVDLDYHRIEVKRLKRGLDSTQPMPPGERKLLGRLYAFYRAQAERKTGKKTPPVYVIQTERGEQMTRQNVGYLLRSLGREAQIDIGVHPHQLRHSTGNHHANDVETPMHILADLMGHADITNTRRYIARREKQFEPYMTGIGPVGRRMKQSR